MKQSSYIIYIYIYTLVQYVSITWVRYGKPTTYRTCRVLVQQLRESPDLESPSTKARYLPDELSLNPMGPLWRYPRRCLIPDYHTIFAQHTRLVSNQPMEDHPKSECTSLSGNPPTNRRFARLGELSVAIRRSKRR